MVYNQQSLFFIVLELKVQNLLAWLGEGPGGL